MEFFAKQARHAMTRHEEMVVEMQRSAREWDGRKREIDAALEVLGDGPPLLLKERN